MGLNMSMDNSMSVEVINGANHLFSYGCLFRIFELLLSFVEQIVKRPLRNIFHNYAQVWWNTTYADEEDDVRMSVFG